MIKATAQKNYYTEHTKSGIFLATNAYAFAEKNASEPGAYIKMEAKGRDLIIKWKREAEGKRNDWGQPTNEFVSAFPAAVLGSLNGREASNAIGKQQLPEGVLRQYGYPAADLEGVYKDIALPTLLKDLKQFRIQAQVEGDMYGCNAFLDLYLQQLDLAGHLPGYKDTLNAINGNFTKRWNINCWFAHPSQINGTGTIANGWTGSTLLATRNIAGRTVQVCLKIERVNGNEFPYISLVFEDGRSIDIDVKDITDWAMHDLWQLIQSNPRAQAMLRTMANPPTEGPCGHLALCGGHLGSEIWWSKPGVEGEIVFRDLAMTINGTTHRLDGIDKPDTIAEPRPKKTPSKKTSSKKKAAPKKTAKKTVITPPMDLSLANGGLYAIPESSGCHGLNVKSMGKKHVVRNPTNWNQASGEAAIMLEPIAAGESTLHWCVGDQPYETLVRVQAADR